MKRLACMGWFISGAIALLLGAAPPPSHSQYVFVWAMEARHPQASLDRASSAPTVAAWGWPRTLLQYSTLRRTRIPSANSSRCFPLETR